jgi:hypothetical protein
MEQGARFEVHIEKGRGLQGDHAKPFEAQLERRDGRTKWTVKDASTSRFCSGVRGGKLDAKRISA